MNHHRTARISQCIFLSIMTLLYVAFMFCDFFDVLSRLSNILKFSSIVGCFFYSMSHRLFQSSDKELLFINVGLFFTVISDIFLLFTDFYFCGVLSFCIVQMIYFCRIMVWRQEGYRKHIIIRCFATFACLCLLMVSQIELDWLLVITIFYFVNFVNNLILLFLTNKSKKHLTSYRLFFYGMTLFFLCDLSVGIFNLSSYLPIRGYLMQCLFTGATFGMWGFYLPGQVLIALSCRKVKTN